VANADVSLDIVIAKTFTKLDLDYCNNFETCGCTCVAVIVTENYYWVANLGDSRLNVLTKVPFGGAEKWSKPLDPKLLSSTELGVRFYTTDHKPKEDISRIRNAGHSVVGGRIDCSLSVSRAFGDFRFKSNGSKAADEQAVIAMPEITKIERRDDDEFILLGCDGVFGNILSNEEMAIAIRSKCGELMNLELAVRGILSVCLKRCSLDNMSIVAVRPMASHPVSRIP